MFNELIKNKDKIEEELNEKLEWFELPGKKASRIKVLRDGNINENGNWEEYFEWFEKEAEKFQNVFLKYIKNVRK